MEARNVRIVCPCGLDSWIVPWNYHGGMDCKACGFRCFVETATQVETRPRARP